MTDAVQSSRRCAPPAGTPDVDPAAGVLLLPITALPARDEAGLLQLTVALREAAGETVAECYTSRQRLVADCGPIQPWVAFPVADSVRLLARAGASVLVVDPGAEGGTIGLDLTLAFPARAGGSR
jgi:hypothetical protein